MKWMILALMPLPATAEPMDSAALTAFWGQNTVTYSSDGVVFGWEEYRPDRRVVWKSAGGFCEYGRWAPGPEGQVCFQYEGGGAPVCWRFDETNGTVTARSVENPAGPVLMVTGKSPEPLVCPGPEVGV